MIIVFAQDVLIMIIELFNTLYILCRWLHKMQLQKLPWTELRHTRCHHTLRHFSSVGVSENSVPLNPMVNDHYPY